MIYRWTTTGAALAALAVTSCSPLQEKAVVHEVKTPTMTTISAPASLRNVYMVPAGSALKYCAEPAPDTALDSVQKLAAEVKAAIPQVQADVAGKLDSELQAKVVQLAGRSQLVVLAREMLYRACELSINNPGGSDQAIKLYTEVAQLVRDLAAAEKAQAAADLVRQSQGSANAANILRQLQPNP
jgi:DNA-binding GntR family transcriptional regulator